MYALKYIRNILQTCSSRENRQTGSNVFLREVGTENKAQRREFWRKLKHELRIIGVSIVPEIQRTRNCVRIQRNLLALREITLCIREKRMKSVNSETHEKNLNRLSARSSQRNGLKRVFRDDSSLIRRN